MPKTTYNTFIELILIQRILFNPISPNDDNSRSYDEDLDITKSDETISYLADCDDVDDNQQESCYKILSLLRKHGLKQYLQNHYDDSHCELIELIFKHIVMKHYTDEYENYVSMTSNKNKNNSDNDNQLNINININSKYDKYFESMVFNQSDLVPKIFQYLDLRDINICSKVNFVWLIHAFNSNSLNYGYLNLYILIKHSYFSYHHQRSRYFRIWQRCGKTTRLEYNNQHHSRFSEYYSNYFDFTKNLGFLRNVNTLLLQFSSFSKTETLFLDALDSSRGSGVFNSDKIVYFEAVNRSYDVPQLRSLRLLNAKSVKMHKMKFNLILSNKCQTIHLSEITIDPAMIEHCDLSGIETFTLDDIKIGVETIATVVVADTESKPEDKDLDIEVEKRQKNICESFAKRLTNIKEISINGPAKDTLLLWKAMIPTINENKCYVYVSFAMDHNKLNKQALSRRNFAFDPFASLNDYNDDIEESYDKMKLFIKDNQARITDIKLCFDRECVNIARKVIMSKDICQRIQIMRLIRFDKKSLFGNYMRQLRGVVSTNEGYFDNLKCIDCDFIFWDELDWKEFCQLFEIFTINMSIEGTKSVFWTVNIAIYWPNKFRQTQLFEYVKQLCQLVNDLFIKLNNPINLKIEFIERLLQSELNDMIKVNRFNDKSKQMKTFWDNYCKDEFLKTFDNLSFAMIKNNCVESNEKYKYDTMDEIKARNDRCDPLPRCYVWCEYFQQQVNRFDVSGECKIEFVMKNALYSQ